MPFNIIITVSGLQQISVFSKKKKITDRQIIIRKQYLHTYEVIRRGVHPINICTMYVLLSS